MEVSQAASHGMGGDMEERTEEDGVSGEENMGMRRLLLVEGTIKEIFSLIRNLQDVDGQGTVSDGGRW